MAIKGKATTAARSTAYAAKRAASSKPTAKNVARGVGRGAVGAAADKHPKGEQFLSPGGAYRTPKTINHGKEVKFK